MCFTVQLSRFLSFLRQPYQITTLRKACQELFFIFLKLFFWAVSRSFLSFSTASLDYHIWADLSSTFFFVFRSFMYCCLTAYLIYHIFRYLSTTFFFFFSPILLGKLKSLTELQYITFYASCQQKNRRFFYFSCFFLM